MTPAVTVTRARHAWPEARGFTIHRPRGIREYTFLRFHGSVKLLLDGQIIETPPGACIFFSTDTPQWFQSPEPLVHDWMHMVGAVPESLEAVGLEPDRLYVPANGRFVTAIIREIEFELLSRQDSNPLPELKYRELLIKLGREVRRETAVVPLRTEVKARLRHVRNVVFSQLDRNWTVREMAELAFLSPSRFHTIYRATFGISPVDDLIHARVDTAKTRLGSSDETVVHLAEQLGYRNVTNFCRQFKSMTGMTPVEFRLSQHRGI